MPTATVQYRDYRFSTTGRPRYSRRVRYESEVTGTPATRAIVTYAVQHLFLEESFADNQLRYRQLLTALKETEGVLFVADENGTELVNQTVRVEEFNLPAQWNQNLSEVEVSFTATEQTGAGSAMDASYTPEGRPAIVLPDVISWKEAIKSDRFSLAVSNRRETSASVSAAGRVRANPAQTVEERRAFLQGQELALKVIMESKDGTLKFGAFNQVIRVDTLETDVHDGSDYLDWSLSCTYRRFPSGDYAEADFTVKTRDDIQNRERATSLQGTVRAKDRAGAKAKADAIVAGYAAGRTMKTKDMDDKQVDGADGATWIEASFSAEFRETLAAAAMSWSLKISDKDDLNSGMITSTYTGKVLAQTSSAALLQARALGDGKYPLRKSSTEEVSTNSFGGDTIVAEVTFSYEYSRKGTRSYAEVTSETDNQTFGVNTTTVTGFTVAPLEATALTLARTFKPGSGLQRSAKETSSTVNAGTGAALHNRIDFSYVFHAARADGSIQYQVKTAADYKAVEASLSYTGTAWAVTEHDANMLIDTLVGTVSGKLMTNERVSSFDQGPTVTAFISRAFSITFATPLSGTDAFGDDGILEATAALETTFSVNQAVITPIPYGTPFVQENVGTTPGLRVATGSVTALTELKARTWARLRVPTGGYPDPAREKVDTIFVSGSSTQIKAYRLDFTYAKRFAQIDF